MVVTEHVLGNAIERTNMEGLNHNLIQITYYLQAHSFYETLQMRYVPAQDIKEHSEVSIMTFKRQIQPMHLQIFYINASLSIIPSPLILKLRLRTACYKLPLFYLRT